MIILYGIYFIKNYFYSIIHEYFHYESASEGPFYLCSRLLTVPAAARRRVRPVAGGRSGDIIIIIIIIIAIIIFFIPSVLVILRVKNIKLKTDWSGYSS